MSDYLRRLWAEKFPPPDEREIWEWAHDEGELPSAYAIQGRFDIQEATFAKAIFRALKSPLVRTVTSMASVQSLKTLIGELWLLWSIDNDPGPTQWLQPDDQEAKEHAKERFLPLIRAFPRIARYYTPNRHDRGTVAIEFSHMWLRMEGAMNLGNAQRKSVKNQMCSEVWQGDKWRPGTLKEFASRLTRFGATSKRYIESQPGMAWDLGVDDMDATYRAGTQKVFQVGCLGCGRLQPALWTAHRADGTRAGMVWDTNERTQRATKSTDPNEIWRWNELRQTLRWECVHCGHRHADEASTRRRLQAAGDFISQAPDAPPEHESFNWNQLIMPDLGWFETQQGGLKNWLYAIAEARQGLDKKLRDFIQKVLAEPYDPRKFAHFDKLATVELQSAKENPSAPMVVEGITFLHRLMGVDVQANSFWVIVVVWSESADELTVFAGETFTWEDVAAAQKEWAVADEDVAVDWSHRGAEVIVECARHGHWATHEGKRHWLCWKAMRGSDRESFPCKRNSGPQKGQTILLPYTWPPSRCDPCHGLSAKDPRRGEFADKFVPLITWSNPSIKDIAISRQRGTNCKVLTRRGEWNDELARQLNSQRKVFMGKTGTGKWRWERFRADHLLDAKCQVIVRAMMRHILGTTR